MLKKIISIFLILLHLAAFGPAREALAFYAEGLNYRLSGAALNSGGAGRASSSYVLLEDAIGGLCKGEFDGDNYVLDGGFVSAALSSPPVQGKDIPGQLIEVGKDKNNAFNLDDYFESPDGIPLTYAVSGNSQINVKIDPQTHKVSITPAKNWQGKETVKFIALDFEGNSVESREVTLRVGSGPVIEQIETVPEKIVKKDAVKIKVKVRNLDKKKIKVTYSDSIKEEKSSQNALEAGVWYSQADWQAAAKGLYRIEITAADSAGLSDSKTISLNVFDTNAPPVLKPIADINIKEGDLAVVSPSASDSDGDALFFYYYAPLDDHGQWRTGFDDAGKYTAEVAASDGRDTVRQTVAIIVENSPRPPDKVGLKVEPATAFMNDAIKITIFPFDPDKEDRELNYSIDKGNGETVKGKIANNTEYAATVKFDKKGEYTVSATITDNDNLSKTEKIGIDIDDINSSVNPIMGDFDGNGLTDLGVHNYANGEWNICLSVKGEFPSAVPWLTNFGDSRDWWPIGGDFDGDGKSDIGIYNWREGQFKAALSTGAGFSAADKWQFSFPEHSEAWRPSTGNFNGDRYTDFIFYNKDDGTIKVALGSSSGFGGFSERTVDLKLKDCAPLSGDFNGDGLADLCLFNKSSGEFTVFFSNTEKFVEGKSWITGFAKDKDQLVADFNNDGLADIGYWDKDSHNWYYAIATGDRFKEIPEKRVWLDSFGTNNDEVATVGDFNGDGIADAAVFDQDKVGITRWTVKIRKDIKPGGLLTDIDNGMGGKTKIAYTYAAESDNKLLPFPVYVTSSVALINTVPAGRYASYAQEFVYSDGYFDPVEREFRGFAKVKVTDAASKNYTETYFLQGRSDKDEDGALKGQIKRIAAYDGNLDYYGRGKIISDTVNKYEVKKAGPDDKNLGFPALTEQVTTVWHENGSSIETKSKFTYDNFGNVIEAKDEADASKAGVPEVQNAIYKKSAQTVYSSPYELGFNHPLEVVLKDKDGNIISKKAFEYDTKGNLIKDTVFILPLTASSVNPQTRYSYDLFGNLVSATNAKGAVVTTDYEITFNTYPQKAVNSLGHTLTYIYEPKFGTLKSTTDANGTITTSAYDSLGRAAGTQINGQPVVTYEYPNFNTKTTTNALGLFKTEYIDGLGRKYKTVSSGEDGAAQRNVSGEVFYNDRGQKEKESLPHYAGEDVKNIAYAKYVYDIRGRVTKTIADFPGSLKDVESSLNYINLLYAESTDPGEHRKGALKDVYGNIIEVTEFTQGGVYKTKYEYDSQNNLTRTIDAQNNAVRIFYDSLGRKTKMIDPDMGTWAYEYDVIGNLIKQTDAKGQVLVFDYDKINRLTKKSLRGAAGDEATEGEARGSAEADRTRLISEYSYDDPTKENCVGRLSKVTDQSGSTEFFYDGLGREKKSIKSLRGAVGAEAIPYTVQREYDALDRLTKLIYPDGEIVNYAYDFNSGLLERVYPNDGRLTTDDYVQSITYNANGQIRAIQYGNNTQTTYDYAEDLRLRRILTKGAETLPLQDLNYTFDANGNVSKLISNPIAANPASNIREFAYDDLDRLVEARNMPDPKGGYTTFTYQYDSIGNMTYKSDVGKMYYPDPGQAHPHAVTKAGIYTYQYDDNGNMTQGKNRVMAYDAENRLTQITEGPTVTSFSYDGDGGRVKKTLSLRGAAGDEAISTTYIGSLFEKDSDGAIRKHIFAGANRVATVSLQGAAGDEAISYYHSDHLGSSNVISGKDGKLVQYCEYTPYGTTARNQGTDVAKHKFNGKELDTTGLYFYGARYYDPEIGRFITADTIVQAPYDPQSLNRYSYCRNNPVNYIDPTGHSWWSKFWKNFGSTVLQIVGIIAAPFTGGTSLYLTYAGLVWSGVQAAQAGQFGAFAAGLGAGLLTAGFASAFLAPAMAGFLAAGSAVTPFQTAIITATEFGLSGAAAGFAGTLAGGGSFGQAGKAAGIGFGAGAAMGGGIGYTYAAGIQDVLHGFDSRGYNQNIFINQIGQGNYAGASQTLSTDSVLRVRVSGAKVHFTNAEGVQGIMSSNTIRANNGAAYLADLLPFKDNSEFTVRTLGLSSPDKGNYFIGLNTRNLSLTANLKTDPVSGWTRFEYLNAGNINLSNTQVYGAYSNNSVGHLAYIRDVLAN